MEVGMRRWEVDRSPEAVCGFAPTTGHCSPRLYTKQRIKAIALAGDGRSVSIDNRRTETLHYPYRGFVGGKPKFTTRIPKMRGIISVVLGLVMIVGGLTGKLALRGTDSGPALAALGGVVLLIGIVRIVKR
jgi:hypothetical protein